MWLTIVLQFVKDNWKAILFFALLIVSFAFGWYTNGNRMQVKIDALTSAINAADAVAKAQVKLQEENADEIQTRANDTAAVINKYYVGLLHAKNTTGPTPISPQAVNGTCQEQTAARLDLEQRCVKDANTLTLWQDWARLNHIPIKD